MKIQKKEIVSMSTGRVVGYALYRERGGKTIYITAEALQTLFGGDVKQAWKEISSLWDRNLLPHTGSLNHPLSSRALAYARENKVLGKRHWRYYNIADRRYYYRGYGYRKGSQVILVDDKGNPFVTLSAPKKKS